VANFTRTFVVAPWGGTISDFANMARATSRLVSEALGADPTLTITVKRPGREDTYDSAETFESGLTSNLKAIERISVNAYPAESPPKVRAYVALGIGRGWPPRGASMTVEGSAEVSVSGVASGLERELAKGHRRAGWVRTMLWAPGWFGGIAIVALLTNVAVARSVSDILLLAGLIVGSLALAFNKWVVPSVELRAVGEVTRLERLISKPTIKLLGLVLTATVAAVVGKLFG
jgi:hypothetical protein